jgi:hypothetical protein
LRRGHRQDCAYTTRPILKALSNDINRNLTAPPLGYLISTLAIAEPAARQLVEYLAAGYGALGHATAGRFLRANFCVPIEYWDSIG